MISSNIVTRAVTSLAPGETKIFYIEIRRRNALLINKAEICNYEEAGEREDYDSDPCTMGPNGNPVQDDE